MHDQFSDAFLDCDIVFPDAAAGMYTLPSAVVELARSYRFVHIGGSGHGALSAAFTAAAEKGRTEPQAGFSALHSTANWMKSVSGRRKRPNLLRMFRPAPKLASAYATVSAMMSASTPAGALKSGMFAALFAFPLGALLGALPGLALAVVSLFGGELWQRILWFLAGLAIAALLAPVAAVLRGIKRTNHLLAKTGFGFSTGMTELSGRPSLMEWMARRLNALAGVKQPGKPLTFGDLSASTDENLPGINLKMTAADLSRSTLLNIPFGLAAEPTADELYYFRPEELKEHFPGFVVDWMVKKARLGSIYRSFEGYLPLPADEDLPVVFATRLAIGAFPLLGAVPLYRTVRQSASERASLTMERCWIGAGGGLRVDAFDEPLPSRPTFSFSFVETVEGSSASHGKPEVWVQGHYRQPAPTLWRPLGDLNAFINAQFHTSRHWEESLLLQTPGYRERIAVVRVPAGVGDPFARLNEETTNLLAELGVSTAKLLVERYGNAASKPGATSWEAHRWIRFRGTMAQLEKHLRELRKGYFSMPEGESSYDRMMMRRADEGTDAYRWPDFARRNHALRVTTQLLDLIERWERDKVSFIGEDLPRPLPELKIVPRP